MNKKIQYTLGFLSITLTILGFLYFVYPRKSPAILSYEIVRIDSTLVPAKDTAMLKEIAPFKHILNDSMEIVLGKVNQALNRAIPEGSLNHFAANAVLYAVQKKKQHADMVLLNYGGLRADIPAGDIKVRNIFEVFPFENKVVILTLSGKTMLELFTFLGQGQGHPIANVKLVFKKGEFYEAFLSGKPFHPEKNYKVATIDYLSHGNDYMFFLKDRIAYLDVNETLRDAVMEYTQSFTLKHQPVKIDTTQRMIFLN